MKSYTTLRNQYARLTKDTSSANLTVGDELINDELRYINALKDWSWLHRLRTDTTVASTQAITFPHDLDQLDTLFVTVSSRRYTPKIIHSRQEWDLLNDTSFTSDIPTHAFVTFGAVELFPTPASSGNTVTFVGKVRVIDLNRTDFTTGTIESTANGDATIVGSGTAWTSPMAGRWIRITNTDTAASSGDGVWYEISSITDATNLETVRTYGGTTLAASAGGAYTMGQMPLLPEAFHDMPVFKAAATHWYNNEDSVKGDKYNAIYTDKRKTLFEHYDSETTDVVLDDGLHHHGDHHHNPNLYLTL